MTKMKIGFARSILAVVALFAASASLWAGDATWNFRSGVGTSPENPTLWTDPDNWKGGEPASGLTATATFPNSGTSSDIVWVKLPDDEYVTLGAITHEGSSSAKYRFIGGKGFYFGHNDYDGGKAAQIKGPDAAYDFYFSPITVCEVSYIDVRGCCLACPMTFEKTDGRQLRLYYPEPCYRCDMYAPCGGETRSCIPALEYLEVAHTASFYAPKNNDAHTGAWVATAGSKLFKYVSGKKGTELAVGQYVHATGVIPEGAYVERIYTSNYIELSEPALASSADPAVGTSINFDPCYYKLTQHLKKYIVSGADSQFAFGERRAAENEMTLSIDEWSGGANPAHAARFNYQDQTYSSFRELAMEEYPQPPVTLLPDMSTFKSIVGGRGAYLRFTSTEPGGADIRQLKFYDSADYKRNAFYVFDAPEGISSTVTCTNEWFGSIGKKGAGDVTVKTHIPGHYYLRVYEGLFALDPSAAGSTLAKATIKSGGTFRLAPGRALTINKLVVEAGGRVSIAAGATLPAPTTLTFSAGGIIRVEEGVTFEASGWNLPDGTVFEGPGAVTGLTSAKIKACEFHGGVSIAVTGSADNLMMTDTTSTNLPTRVSPAFWVSAKAADSLIYGESGKPNLITQWNDCRGTPEQGYHFATNAMPGGFRINDTTYAPYLAGSSSGTGGPLVWMRKTATTVSSPGNSPALVWDTPITGIKAVFAVVAGQFDNHNGGGSLLGSTERLTTCDFYRQGFNSWYNDRFSSDNPNLWNAPYYINGQLPPDGQTLAGSKRTKPMLNGCFEQVVDVHPLGEGAEADCWGYQRSAPNKYGAWIGECIIYTNAVTDVERRRIENYLMAKWFGSRVVAAEIVPPEQEFSGDAVGGANLNVAAGDAVSIPSLTNANGLVKSGAGVVYLKGLQTTGALSVQGGTVNVQSYDVTTNFVLPAGALIHVDANDDDSFPGVTATDGGQSVPKWIDTDNPDNPLTFQIVRSGYGIPTRKTDETSFARPMKVVDYGALHTRYDDDWTKDALGWWGSDERRVAHVLKNGNASDITNAPVAAVFAVWGTAAGGNQLLGGYDKRATGTERDYTNSTIVAVNIAKPILNNVDNDNRTTYNSAVNCESLALMNGNEILPGATPPSGAYDVVSMLLPYRKNCSSLGFYSVGTKTGGLQMGELILYADSITAEEARRIDAYLNYKWFGREPGATCRAAHVGVLDVAAGAVVNVEGNAPIVCSALKGAGTVNGDVRIGGDTVFEVFVNADGSISPGPAVSGAVDMSRGGTVRLTGYVNALVVGDYQLIASSSVNFGGEWTIEGYEGRKKIVLRKRSDCLWLSLVNDAFVIIIR